MGGLRVDVMVRAGVNEARFPRGLTLVKALGREVIGPFEPVPDAPAIVIELEQFSFGEFPTAYLAEMQTPGEWQPEERTGVLGPMFNGRFVWTSDSRFAQALGLRAGAAPVALKDRWETPAEYATYD